MGKKSDRLSSVFSESTTPIYQLWAWILLLWSLYRYFFRLPEWADELIFKPVVFALPILWYVTRREKRKLETVGLSMKKFTTNLLVGIGFGMVFAIEGIAVHYLKYKTFDVKPVAAFTTYGFGLLFLSLATAFSEELLCRGFLFQRLWEKSKNLLSSALVSSGLFMLLHVPMLLMVNRLQGATLLMFFVTDFILSMANSMLIASTGSLVAVVLVHLFWNMTVALYL